jgi:hypothetical protein
MIMFWRSHAVTIKLANYGLESGCRLARDAKNVYS